MPANHDRRSRRSGTSCAVARVRLLHKLLREHSKGDSSAINVATLSKVLPARQRWLLNDKRERYNCAWHIR